MRKRSLYSPGGAATGNVGTGEDTLKTFTLPANSLATNGDYIEIDTHFNVVNNANQKRVKLYFGSVAIFDTGATGLAVSTGYDIRLQVILVRTASNTQKGFINYVYSAVGGTPIATTQTDTADIIIKGTGETNAASNNDVTQIYMVVKPGEHTV